MGLEPHELPLLDFVPALTRHFHRPTHLAPIAQLLEATERGPIRAVASAPPRHSKTELVLHYIAWSLVRNPRTVIGYASHSAALALSKSRVAREYAKMAGVKVKKDSDSVSEWRTEHGGGCLAAGVLGSWTGFGVDKFVIDDPYEGRAGADSALIRGRVQEWYQSVASTRVEPGGSVMVFSTRWHERDLIGWLTSESEERDEYQTVNLPALDRNGNALWPERWCAEELLKKKAAVGPFEWASLYMGTPMPRGGEVFKGPPAVYTQSNLDGARLVIGIDPAGTEGTASDYTAAVVLAVKGYGAALTADVLEVDRFRLVPSKAAPRLAALKGRYPSATTYIESTRDGKEITRTLQTVDKGLHFIEVPSHSSKLLRAGPAAGAWEEGRIRVPMIAPWLDEFMYEITKFTGVGDARDDQVDALSLVYNCAVNMSCEYKMHRVPSSRYSECGLASGGRR